MKVAFIIPPSKNKKKFIRLIDCSHEAKANYLWQPNDFIIISSYFKNQDELYFIDGTVDELSKDNFFKEIYNVPNDISIIFFATGSVAYYEDFEYLKEIRRIFFNSTLCILGDVFIEENFRKHVFENDIDAIIYRPYNIDIFHISKIRYLKLNKQNFDHESVITNFKEHPFLKNKSKKVSFVKVDVPKHSLFKKRYSWPFLTTRNFTTITSMWGCTYSCSYCTSGLMHPICKTNDDILEELKHIKKLGFKEVQYFDKVFGVPKNTRKELLKKIIDEKINLKFSCYFHPSLFDEELLFLMKKAGCHTIVVGIDSKDLKKLALYNRKVNEDVLHRMLDYADQINLSVCADFIIGLPHESKQDIMNTIEYAKKIKIDFASFNIAAPLPGSVFRKNAIENGIIEKESLHDTLHSNLSVSEIPLNDILKIREKANFSFYLRWKIIFNRLKRLQSYEHFLIQADQFSGMLKNNFFGKLMNKN
jgi:anaerobic magnesium-protoporphyrin IX monomethyl ester cyclase